MSLKQAEKPFRFSTRLSVRESTGIRAVTLPQLVKHMQTVPESVIYHHTHHYLQQHQYLNPEPPNDFAYWVTEILGDKVLGEKLASINTVEFTTLEELRQVLIKTIEDRLSKNFLLRLRFAAPEDAFYFTKTVSVIYPLPFSAHNLEEFAHCLEKVGLESLYYHMFEARLRLRRGTNDFSNWLKESLGEERLAQTISELDPYTHTMEELRQTLIRLVQRRVRQLQEMAR